MSYSVFTCIIFFQILIKLYNYICSTWMSWTFAIFHFPRHYVTVYCKSWTDLLKSLLWKSIHWNRFSLSEKLFSFLSILLDKGIFKCTLLGLNFAGIKFRGWPYLWNLNISRGFNFADSLLSNFSRISRMRTPNLWGILRINLYGFLII